MENTIALAGYGADIKGFIKQDIGKFVYELARLSEMEVDSVSSGTIGIPGFFQRNFRSSASAMEFLLAAGFPKERVAATQRAPVKGQEDIASIQFRENTLDTKIIFPGRPILEDQRVTHLISFLISANAHYIYGLNVESHLFGVCFLGGSTLSKRMSDATSRNMTILMNSIHKGERFADRIFDVFPINVLNSRHLAARVGGRTLEELISANGWGRLDVLSIDRWLWRMTDAEIVEARATLVGNELMLATT